MQKRCFLPTKKQNERGVILAKNKLNQRGLSTIVLPIGLGVFVLVLWQSQILHTLIGVDTFTLPLPGRIIGIISGNISKIAVNMQSTVTVALGGLLLGSLLGYLLAIIATAFPKWGPGGLSVVSSFNAIPIIAIAPILNNLTKDFSRDPSVRSMLAKILVVMITCTVSMSVNAYRGFTELKPFSEDLMKSLAANKSTIFLKLKVPNSVPYIFTALRVSVPASVISAMVSEYFAEYIIGVGRQIRENIVLAQYATAWAYIIAAIAIGITMYVLLLTVEKFSMKGRP
jgi:NitT/TauT family transport system permease protein